MDDVPQKKRTAPRSEKRQREPRVTVRFLPDEYEKLNERAKAAGLKNGPFLRACALGEAGPRAQRSPTIDRELAAKAIAELNKAGSNLNQIAHSMNMDIHPAAPRIAAAADAVNLAALQILRAFGYKTHDSQREPAQ
jgi:hypothetical protein